MSKSIEPSDNKIIISTYQYRIKDSNEALVDSLMVLSAKVNYLWNFVNNSQKQVIDKNNAGYQRKYWLNKHDLHELTTGSSKLINIPAQTIQAINEEYLTRRVQFNKPYLKNRTNRKNRNLPWIPFKAQDIKMDSKGTFTYHGLKLKTWYSRELPKKAKITNGSLTRDNLGHWFINITFKVSLTPEEALLITSPGQNKTGIDIGLNPFMTMCLESPEGELSYKEILPEKIYRTAQEKLGKAQRAKRFNQAKVMNKKIKNKRKDLLHKISTSLVKDNTEIVMGLVELKNLIRKKGLKGHAKAWTDNGYGLLKSMLKTKAYKHNMEYKEISEREIKSTQKCSCCGGITGPKGLEGLGVSQWKCLDCSAEHNRNENSARNHLLAGKIPKGNLKKEQVKQEKKKARKNPVTALETKLS